MSIQKKTMFAFKTTKFSANKTISNSFERKIHNLVVQSNARSIKILLGDAQEFIIESPMKRYIILIFFEKHYDW